VGAKLVESKLSIHPACQGPLFLLLLLLLKDQDNLGHKGYLRTSQGGRRNSLCQQAEGCPLCTPMDLLGAGWAWQAWGCLLFPPTNPLSEDSAQQEEGCPPCPHKDLMSEGCALTEQGYLLPSKDCALQEEDCPTYLPKDWLSEDCAHLVTGCPTCLPVDLTSEGSA